MSLNYVTLTFSEQDAGQDASSGTVTVAPTSVVTAAGVTVVSQQPVTRQMSGGSASVQLVACDNTGTTPAAGFWAYLITLPGSTTPGTYLVNFSNGATQRFDSLTPAVASVTYGPAASGGGFASPMTTLGDLIYENATPAAARLPGNTTTTRNFLRQVGTGSASAAPAWDTVQAGDLPTATTSVQGAVIIDGTAADIQPDGVAAAGAKGQAADAKHVHPYQPWQFAPEAYGAKGNGRVISDVTTNGTSTITSPTIGAEGSAAVGKYLMIHGANGAANGPYIGTITAVSGNNVTLSGTAPTASVASCPAVYGNDDTAAIQSAITAAGSYAMTVTAGVPGSGGYFAEVVFGAKVYCLAAALQQVGNGSSTPTFYSQLTIPYPATNGQSQKLVFQLTGAGDNGWTQYWDAEVPQLAGTCLVSFASHNNTPDPTYGRPSVIGGPTSQAGFSSSITPFANVRLVVKGISVWQQIFGNLIAYNFAWIAQLRVQQSSAMTFAPPIQGTAPHLTGNSNAFGNTLSAGFWAPAMGNNVNVVFDDCTVMGYGWAYVAADWLEASMLQAVYNDTALMVNTAIGPTGQGHIIHVGVLDAESYNYGVRTNAGGGTQSTLLDIRLVTECTGVVADIYDPSGYFRGEVRFTDEADVPRGLTVNGAANLKVIWDILGPGVWTTPPFGPSAPAAPSSGTSQQNTAWRDAIVTVTSTAAITAVTVDGNTIFSGSVAAGNPVAVPVPAGHSYVVTSAGGTLTTHWMLY